MSDLPHPAGSHALRLLRCCWLMFKLAAVPCSSGRSCARHPLRRTSLSSSACFVRVFQTSPPSPGAVIGHDFILSLGIRSLFSGWGGFVGGGRCFRLSHPLLLFSGFEKVSLYWVCLSFGSFLLEIDDFFFGNAES